MNDSPDSLDMEKMIRVIKMAKMMENTIKQNEEYAEGNEYDYQKWRLQNDFDGEIQTEYLRMIKAAIPFLDIKYQKNLSVIVKLMEIQKLSQYYDAKLKNIESRFGEEQNTQSKPSPTEMLRAVRKELSEEKRQKIDTIIKIMDATEMMSKVKEMED